MKQERWFSWRWFKSLHWPQRNCFKMYSITECTYREWSMGIGLNEDNNAMYKVTVHFLFPHSLDHRIGVGVAYFYFENSYTKDTYFCMIMPCMF